MSADPSRLRFYVDESLVGLGKVLELARRDVIHVNHPLIEEQIPFGTLDPDWIPVVASRGLIAITHDKRLRTRPGERELVLASGLRIVRIENKNDLSTWSLLDLLVRRWDRMEEEISAAGEGPCFMEIAAG